MDAIFDEIDQLHAVHDNHDKQLELTRSILEQCWSAALRSQKRNAYETSAIEVAAKKLLGLLTKS